jgi:CheY-like chemotaxis protein
MLLRLIGEDISLKFIPGAPLGSVRADLAQIEQILMNLAVNSRDAMPRGGTIIIETANAELDNTYQKDHLSVVPGSYVRLSVSDTGCGMDPAVLSRIFEPFFTTKPVGQGTGLGLATVYGIVNQSDGYVWVYSEPSRGTTFKMYFPRVDEPAQSLIQPRKEEEIVGGSETILLVEDDDALHQLIVGLLESEGYKVLPAKDGPAALALTAQYSDPIHLLLSDVIMPAMSGSELAVHLKRSRPGLGVIYMSGYTGNLIAHHGLQDSNAILLQKPFTKQSLLHLVRTVLDS